MEGLTVPADEARAFWARVDTSDPDACWEWTGTRQDRGYGRVQVQGHRNLAHRAAYAIAHGITPKGLCVCHRCDNPPCVKSIDSVKCGFGESLSIGSPQSWESLRVKCPAWP